jgi:hypothetical protein
LLGSFSKIAGDTKAVTKKKKRGTKERKKKQANAGWS